MKNKDKNKGKIVKVSTFLILLGVLRGYLNSPLWFLIKSKITFITFKKGIELELPSDFIDSSGFIAWLYMRLKDKVGQEKAFEIIRAGILTSGLAVQQASFRNVEEQRTFENLIRYQQKTNKEGITRFNTMEIIEESENRYEFRITRCMFYEIFSYLKVPELTSIICSIDNAIFNTYLPEKLTFHRNGINKTFAQGNDFCEFVIENNERKSTKAQHFV